MPEMEEAPLKAPKTIEHAAGLRLGRGSGRLSHFRRTSGGKARGTRLGAGRMAADAGGGHRLRLRRRRPPPVAGPPSARPWFLQEADGGNAEPWAALLRALRPDKDLASPPAFPRQEPKRSPEKAPPSEVFTVGGKAFTWTPFPQPPPRRSALVYCPPQEAVQRPGSHARSPSQCHQSEIEPLRTLSTEKLLPSAVQTGLPSVEEKPPPSVAEEKPPPSVAEEKPPSVAENPLTLTSCPMCLTEFGTTLSQLDVDGHLAQCLADSTDDVMW
ncbi:PREDICTED: Fanconi anemia-associated protein of 20 kDa-like [Elephantulus edwardii]|uniref:Fanconi anemia-associated protein of 20 kDa-like n=1 Tax=Elephantulus edwardii TaxID=28737 RepID=UPI0003F0B893|nr:PREDICTED: Fanconi anemia-associated protein of 20 kDa-like [Elephantulus edwardii]